MDNLTKQVLEIRHRHVPKSKTNWQRQQDYYQRLKKAGITKQQTYNLAPVALLR